METKVVEDERAKKLQSVGWRLMEQTYMKPHARQPSYWLSPTGVSFYSLEDAWKAFFASLKREVLNG